MSSILVLLSPIWISWKNDFLRRGRSWRRRWLLLGLALAFWCGTYYVIRRVLLYFQSVYDLGPSLAYQLLLIILLTFLSMLLFQQPHHGAVDFLSSARFGSGLIHAGAPGLFLLFASHHDDVEFFLDGAFF
jgi:hypothetical protein